jgi:hypothetical protein
VPDITQREYLSIFVKNLQSRVFIHNSMNFNKNNDFFGHFLKNLPGHPNTGVI